MALVTDQDYYLQFVRLAYLRYISPTTPIKLARSTTNPYLNASGLTDNDKWPEIDQLPPSPTLNHVFAEPSSSKSSDLTKFDEAPTRGSSLKYTQTIVGPGRSLALSMRTSARLATDLNHKRRGSKALNVPTNYLDPEKSDSSNHNSGNDPKAFHVQTNVDEEVDETDIDQIPTIQSEEDDDDDYLQLERNASPSSASYNASSQVNIQDHIENSNLLSSTDNIPSHSSNTHKNNNVLNTRPRGASTSTADADDEDEFRQQQTNRIQKHTGREINSPPQSTAAKPNNPLTLAVQNNTSRFLDSKRPLTMTRGNSLSAVEEINPLAQVQLQSQLSNENTQLNRFRSASASASTNEIEDPKNDQSITKTLQKLNNDKEKEKEVYKANLLKKQPIEVRNRPQSSNLTKLIQAKTETQRTVKDPQQYKHNPFRKYYAALVAENGSSSVNLSLYFPNSSQPKEPIRVQMRKDSTCEEVIGYGLYSFVQQREKDCKEMFGTSNDNVRWTAEGWNLRIVEEDGEVDEDFPALDRLRPVAKFSFDELAICEASTTQVRSNQMAASKIQRRQSRITEDPFMDNTNNNSNNHLTVPNANPSSSTTSLENTIEQSSVITPTLSRSATAGVSSSLAPSVYLRIEVHPAADVSYTTTVSVPSDMYLQDVLEMVCTKKNLKNPNSWALLVKSAALVIPLDRTVASLEGVSSLMLIKRSHIEADLRLDRRMEMARSTNPNASIFKRLSKDPTANRSGLGSRQGLNPALDFTSAYRKYTVNRRILGVVGKHERILAIDGDWIHIMPPEHKSALIDSKGNKTRSYHASNMKACKHIKKGEQHFRLDFWRGGGKHVKRYEFEADSVRQANEIINQMKSLMTLFKSERSALARFASKH